jgi:hypothetical protein
MKRSLPPMPKHVSTFFPEKKRNFRVPPSWQVAAIYRFMNHDLKATCFALRLTPDAVRELLMRAAKQR